MAKKKILDDCEDVSNLKNSLALRKKKPYNKEEERARKEKKHPDHLLFIAIQFCKKSGLLIWFSEERKYSY